MILRECFIVYSESIWKEFDSFDISPLLRSFSAQHTTWRCDVTFRIMYYEYYHFARSLCYEKYPFFSRYKVESTCRKRNSKVRFLRWTLIKLTGSLIVASQVATGSRISVNPRELSEGWLCGELCIFTEWLAGYKKHTAFANIIFNIQLSCRLVACWNISELLLRI